MLKKILALLAMLYAAAAFAAVDVNKATAAELDAVKGIGPAISGKIVDERKKGSFKDWQDFIDRVKGVGEGNAAKFSAEGLTVNGTSYKGAAAKAEDKKAAATTAPAAKTAPAATTAAASAPKADAKPAAAASAAKDDKMDAKAEAKAKKEADKKAKAEEKAKKAEEAKAKKEEAKAKKAAAKEAKPAASAASAASAKK